MAGKDHQELDCEDSFRCCQCLLTIAGVHGASFAERFVGPIKRGKRRGHFLGLGQLHLGNHHGQTVLYTALHTADLEVNGS